MFLRIALPVLLSKYCESPCYIDVQIVELCAGHVRHYRQLRVPGAAADAQAGHHRRQRRVLPSHRLQVLVGGHAGPVHPQQASHPPQLRHGGVFYWYFIILRA